MVDHGVLNGKAAARSQDRLIIRGAVLARIGDLPCCMAALAAGRYQPSALVPDSAMLSSPPMLMMGSIADDGHQVDILDRLLQNGDVCVQIGGRSGPLRHDEIAAAVNRDRSVAAPRTHPP